MIVLFRRVMVWVVVVSMVIIAMELSSSVVMVSSEAEVVRIMGELVV